VEEFIARHVKCAELLAYGNERSNLCWRKSYYETRYCLARSLSSCEVPSPIERWQWK